ncbi:MAG TPA: His/Gly/Thr/Pro-type tRNA ligase C-terminal domain-containing protein, partial [Anaerolineae bacterium]|nr:His/Gly/Thr/Pro-type tRNA ligase C-terminal domain-containing protein [Anaerolineae bacterium]
SMFGGGRYNGLANIFGEQDIPAVGFAPGDETTRLFLENWQLIPDYLMENRAIYLPVLDETLIISVNKLAIELRQSAFQIAQGLELQSLKQALSYANNRKIPYVIIYGPDEASQAVFGLKDMKTGKQTNFAKTALFEELARIRGRDKAE